MRRRRTLVGPLDPHYYYWLVLLVTTASVVRSSQPTCRTDAKSISSKTYVSPYVFEGSVVSKYVQSTDDDDDDRDRDSGSPPTAHVDHGRRHLHRVTFRVDKIHKGDASRISIGGAQKQISLQFRSSAAAANHRCVFRPDIFESRRKFIVFAADANGRRANVTRIMTTATDDASDNNNDDDDDVLDDDVWRRSNQAATEIPTFFVFCEPVALTKKSSRRIQKILRRAKPPTVSGLKNVTVRLHKRLKLVCRAKGRPAPTITWFKDGRPLVENSNVIIKFNRSISQLMIKNTLADDAGLYECRATIDSTGLSSVVNATVTVKKRGRSVSSTTPNSTSSSKSGRKGYGDTYTGKECPVEHFCQNNSTCVFIENLGEAYCRCVDGFVGGRCEHKNVFFVLGEVKQMDWTYHKNILTVVVILGVLLCITILSNVTYFIFRAKRKIQKEKKQVPTDDDGGGGGGGRRRLSAADAIEMQHVVSNAAEMVRCRDDFYVSDDDRKSTIDRRSRCSTLLLQPPGNRDWRHGDASNIKRTMMTKELDPPCCYPEECHSRQPDPLGRRLSSSSVDVGPKRSSLRRLHRLYGVSEDLMMTTTETKNKRSPSVNRTLLIRDRPECSKDDNDDDAAAAGYEEIQSDSAGIH